MSRAPMRTMPWFNSFPYSSLLDKGLEIFNQAFIAKEKRFKRVGPADRQIPLKNNAIDTRKGSGYPALVFRKKCIHGNLRFY